MTLVLLMLVFENIQTNLKYCLQKCILYFIKIHDCCVVGLAHEILNLYMVGFCRQFMPQAPRLLWILCDMSSTSDNEYDSSYYLGRKSLVFVLYSPVCLELHAPKVTVHASFVVKFLGMDEFVIQMTRGGQSPPQHCHQPCNCLQIIQSPHCWAVISVYSW